MVLIRKAGASNHARPAVCPTVAGSHVSNGQVFARIGFDPEIGRTVTYYRDDFSSHRTVAEVLAFIPAGRTQEGAGVDTPSGSSANLFKPLVHGATNGR